MTNMKVNNKILRVRRGSGLHAASFLDIDHQNTNLSITSNTDTCYDDVFTNSKDVWKPPEYIKILCELKPIKDFKSDILIYAKYQRMPDDESSITEMNYMIYDGITIPGNALVSAIDISYIDILPSSSEADQRPIPDAWHGKLLQNNSIIHSKKFKTQEHNIANAELEIDDRFDVTAYNHYISKAYALSGFYHNGIQISDIQQYFFYIGSELQAEEYIKTMSSRELLSSNFLRPDSDIRLSQITSLEDDITDGCVKIEMPGQCEDDETTTYESINIQKNTTISDRCILTFKRRK